MTKRQSGLIYISFLICLIGILFFPRSSSADLNGDGFADAVYGALDISDNKYCLGDGCGNFSCSNINTVANNSEAGSKPAIGDMNNDGLPDVVFGSFLVNRHSLCLNNGNTGPGGIWDGFTCTNPILTAEIISSGEVAIGFVDDDENLDAVYAGSDLTLLNFVAYGDGSGGYTDFMSLPGVDVSRGVALGHIDDNGLLDIVFANVNIGTATNRENQVCLQTELGTFSCSDISDDQNNSFDVALADLNGDDNLDAVFANSESKNKVCLGDGMGDFTCSDVLIIFNPTDSSSEVALADLNGNNIIDGLFSNQGEDATNCTNLSGTFGCGPALTGIQTSISVAMEDMNGDGLPDAIFGNDDSDQPSTLCFGNGSSTAPFFSDCKDINTGLTRNVVALSPGTHQSTDSDGDTITDTCDNCPDDSNVGQEDDDGDGVGDECDQCPDEEDTDSDNDGVANCLDNCPEDADKIEPGICGCGISDDDSDNDGTPDCNDGCPNDINKTDPGICGCGVSDDDTDSDGTEDCNEECDGDPDKTEPGECGCGIPDTDTDSDGAEDCNEECDNDPDKTVPGICGCGTPDTDSDTDGTPDCNEECDSDPDKTQPGQCGCGNPDTDTDLDGTADCNDLCIDDPDKTEPGICGCGIEDTDTDSDGTQDCNEECIDDPDKTEAGICGCGTPDTDTDFDGTVDCNDMCPDDPNKTAPGECGCGIQEGCNDGNDDDDEIIDDNEPNSPPVIETGDGGTVIEIINEDINNPLGPVTINIDLPGGILPQSAVGNPPGNGAMCSILNTQNSRIAEEDIDISCEVENIDEQFELFLGLCDNGSNELVAEAVIEIISPDLQEVREDFIDIIVNQLNACQLILDSGNVNDGGENEDCSLAPAGSKPSASGLLFLLIPAFVLLRRKLFKINNL